jgi:hypothetical protein
MAKQNVTVAIYKSHQEAEAAIKELQQAGFNMKNLSIVGKDYHTEEQVLGFYNTGDRVKYWGKLGAFWGGDSSACYSVRHFLLFQASGM